MDLNEIKSLINNEGERLIFVENGKPSVVLLSFSDYKKIFSDNNNNNKLSTHENQNKESPEMHFSAALQKEFIGNNKENEMDTHIDEKKREAQEVQELKEELKRELTLEDLPF